MRYLTVIIIFAIIFFSQCESKPDDQQATTIALEDSTERLDTVFSQPDISFLNQLRVSKYANSQNVPIDWSEFRMVTSSHDDSLLVSPFQPDSAYYQQYGRFLRYSPDSSMFIDLDS